MKLEAVEYLGHMVEETIVEGEEGKTSSIIREFEVLKKTSGKDESFLITKDFEHHDKAVYTLSTFETLKVFLKDVEAEYDLTYQGKRYVSSKEDGLFVSKRQIG